jgi:hypothetical protein
MDAIVSPAMVVATIGRQLALRRASRERPLKSPNDCLLLLKSSEIEPPDALFRWRWCFKGRSAQRPLQAQARGSAGLTLLYIMTLTATCLVDRAPTLSA